MMQSQGLCSRVVLPNPTAADAAHIAQLRPAQSPLAISVRKCPRWSTLAPLSFSGYWGRGATLANTGQTAYFTLDGETRPQLRGGPVLGEYVFEQMHFHWSVDDYTGCEHVLDGKGYAAECHLVHYNGKYRDISEAVGHPDGLAVVGFLLESGDRANPGFDSLVAGLQAVRKKDCASKLPSDSLAWMDQSELTSGAYVTYKGSLTTPPYTECVTWILFEKPVKIGSEQLDQLRQLEGADNRPIERNVRPTQRHPAGHSVIYVQPVQSKL